MSKLRCSSGHVVATNYEKPPGGGSLHLVGSFLGGSVLGIVAKLEGKMVLWSAQISEYVEVRTM